MSETEPQRRESSTDSEAQSDSGVSWLVDAPPLGEFVDHLTPLVNESKIRPGADGLTSQAVDPANVASINVSLNKEAFESYQGQEGAVLGVNLERFDDVVGFGSSGDLVHARLNSQTRKLELDVGGLGYTLVLIDPDSLRQEPDLPDLWSDNESVEFVVEGRELKRAAKAADMVSDHIGLAYDTGEGAVVIDAEGDADDVQVTVGDEDLISAPSEGQDVRSLFSLDYLTDSLKPVSSDTEARVQLGQELPIGMEWEFADGFGHTELLLAPRIQNQ